MLLLLPSSTKKFVVQWQGTYQVTRLTGKVNYETRMPAKGGRKQVFHINHLRKWQEQTSEVNTVIEDRDGIKDYHWSNVYQTQFGQWL